MAPKRIQLSRAKGWRKPEGAIVVARPSRWGNLYVAGTGEVRVSGEMRGRTAGAYDPSEALWFDEVVGSLTAEQAVELYRRDLLDALADASDDEVYGEIVSALDELRGHDLACWCSLYEPCHGDPLLEMANR